MKDITDMNIDELLKFLPSRIFCIDAFYHLHIVKHVNHYKACYGRTDENMMYEIVPDKRLQVEHDNVEGALRLLSLGVKLYYQSSNVTYLG